MRWAFLFQGLGLSLSALLVDAILMASGALGSFLVASIWLACVRSKEVKGLWIVGLQASLLGVAITVGTLLAVVNQIGPTTPDYPPSFVALALALGATSAAVAYLLPRARRESEALEKPPA